MRYCLRCCMRCSLRCSLPSACSDSSQLLVPSLVDHSDATEGYVSRIAAEQTRALKVTLTKKSPCNLHVSPMHLPSLRCSSTQSTTSSNPPSFPQAVDGGTSPLCTIEQSRVPFFSMEMRGGARALASTRSPRRARLGALSPLLLQAQWIYLPNALRPRRSPQFTH